MCPSTLVEFTLEELETGWTDDGEYIPCFPCLPETDLTLEGYGSGRVTMIGDEGVRDGPQFYFWSLRQRAGMFETRIGTPYRRIGPRETYDLSEEDLAICPGNCLLGPENNSVVLTVNNGDAIDFWFRLLDDDPVEDDVWCGTEEDVGIIGVTGGRFEKKSFRIGPYSTDEWSEMHTVYQFDNTGEALSDHDARCYLRVRVRGVGRTP
jgi:hypothetical protein